MQEQSFFSRQAAKSAKKSVPQIWCSPKSIDESLCRFAGVGFVSCTRNYYNSAAYPTRVWRSSQTLANCLPHGSSPTPREPASYMDSGLWNLFLVEILCVLC